MPLTKSFEELVQRRVTTDPDFAAALLHEEIDATRAGDVNAGKAILRDDRAATEPSE